MSALRTQPIGRYFALFFLLVLALVYQVRYTIYRYPSWFGRHLVEFPCFVFPDSEQPVFRVYLFGPIPNIENNDQVLAINGRPMTGSAIFGEAIAHSRPGDSLHITVRHSNGTTETVSILLRAAEQPPVTSVGFWLALILYIIFPWFCLIIGFWVAAVRIQDVRAWILLCVMLSFAGFFTPAPESWESWIRDFAMAYHRIITDLLPLWLLLLGIYFPEPFPSESRWARWTRLKWAIVVVLVLATVFDVARFVGGMENYASVFPLQRVGHPLTSLLGLADVVGVVGMWLFLFVKFRLAISSDARRRLRVLVTGALVSLGPVVSLATIASIAGSNLEQFFPEWVYLPAWLLFFLFPVTLAYIVVVHRAMDVRVVIRQGLKYALARRGIRVLEEFAARIDRRFFREAYNAEQLLAELSETVRSIVEARPLLATVAGRISQAMRVPQVAVLTNGSGPYQPAYAGGFNPPPDVSFPHDAATIRQLKQAREPARIYLDDPNSWLYRAPGMTEEERNRLRMLASELLLPLAAKDELLGFISLGSRQAEEPYSPADLRVLQSVAVQTGLALEVARLTSAVAEETARRERLSRELEIAREVQERLFPQNPPITPGLDYCGACRPALGVGGDYYDFLLLPGGQLGIALGDVSGKGIAAALMMASLQASLRAEASRPHRELGEMIGEVNRLLYEASTQNRYATFFYAQYDPATRALSYVNAGHNPPMLFNRQASAPTRLDIGGTVVGLLKSFPFQSASIALEPGDLLVAFTDGITETMNVTEEEWGEENLVHTIESCCDLSSAEILAHIIQAADAFAAGAPQHDDMTLIVLRVT